MNNGQPNPGSVAAQLIGCECPVCENQYGRGYMGQAGVYVRTVGCPVHDPAGADTQPKQRKTDRPYTRKTRATGPSSNPPPPVTVRNRER